jgi:hypothetical protein
MSNGPDKGGFIVTDDGLKYCVTVKCNRPFCHACRQQVDQVSVLERLQGNPLNICASCLSTRLAGFESLSKQ